MTAKIITPTIITDSILTSTAAEPGPGEVEWNSNTAYTIGNVVIRATTHRKYQRVVAGTSATIPENDTANWLDIGPTNRWAMFDRKVGTKTVLASPLTMTFKPGATSSVALLELVGRQVFVSMKDAPSGTTIYSKTVPLDGTVITSFYDWFYAEYEQRTDLVLTDLPATYSNCELTVSLTGTTSVSVGALIVGTSIDVGDTQYGASVGINDYSKKVTDSYGNIDVVERAYSKRMSLQVMTSKADFNKLFRKLASLRATPCIYIGAEEIGYEPLLVYGFFKSFGIAISYEMVHLCSLDIEGLV